MSHSRAHRAANELDDRGNQCPHSRAHSRAANELDGNQCHTPELTELLMSLMEGGRAVPGAWSASLRSETVPEM